MPSKIPKATLSQSAVAAGIAIDKARMLRAQEPEPDPTDELCRLLKLDPNQLPETLELAPGEEIPEVFLKELLPVIETKPNANGVMEPVSGRQFHHADFGRLHSAPNQSDLPSGYLRLIDIAGNLFILPAADQVPVENDGNPSQRTETDATADGARLVASVDSDEQSTR